MLSVGGAAIVIIVIVIVCVVLRLENVVSKVSMLAGLALLVVSAAMYAVVGGEPIRNDGIVTDSELVVGLISEVATLAYFALVVGTLLVLVERIREMYKKDQP